MDSQIILILVFLVAGISVVGFGVVMVRRNQSDAAVEDRLEDDVYGYAAEDDDDLEEELSKGPSSLQKAADAAVIKTSMGKTWERQLYRANLKLTVGEYFAIHILSMILFGVLGAFVVFRTTRVLGILAAFVGFFIPRIYVARVTSRRLHRFEDQLPDTLSTWVNALRAGYSVTQAMESIAKNAPQPTGYEFQRVIQEVALAIDLEDALDHMLERVESEDLDLIITAVSIQREVGGNLAEILEVISGTIRDRIKLKGEIRVLTSQGRITGYLIGGLPIALAIFLWIIQPEYMGRMFNSGICGWALVGSGLSLIAIGQAIIQKIVDIDI